MYHKTTSCANALDIEMRKFAEQENEREACGLKNHNPQKICSIAREILNWWIKNQTTQKRHKVKKKTRRRFARSLLLFFFIFLRHYNAVSHEKSKRASNLYLKFLCYVCCFSFLLHFSSASVFWIFVTVRRVFNTERYYISSYIFTIILVFFLVLTFC